MLSRPGLRPRVIAGCVALSQLGSVLMSVAPVIMDGQEDRAAQSWSCPLLTAAPREQFMTGQQGRADPVGAGGRGELALRT